MNDKNKNIMSMEDFLDACIAGVNYYESKMHGDGSLADLMDETLDPEVIKLGLMALSFSLLNVVSEDTEIEVPVILSNIRKTTIKLANENPDN
jgi:hypothetical protein